MTFWKGKTNGPNQPETTEATQPPPSTVTIPILNHRIATTASSTTTS